MLSPICNFPVQSPLKIAHSPSYHRFSPSTNYNCLLQKRKESLLIRRPTIRLSSLKASAGGKNENVVGVVENASQRGQIVLPEGLRPELMPKHVALFPDGTRPSGKQSGFKTFLGYMASAQKLKQIVSICYKWGIEVVSVFAFSSENWIRQEEEVGFGKHLLEQAVKKYLEVSIRKGIRVTVIGDRTKLPDNLRARLIEAEEATRTNSVLHVVIALDYNGHYDITQACKALAGKVRDGLIQLEDIDDAAIEQDLLTNCTKFPNPDLFIRTSGGSMTDNFMCWQLAYSELYFVDKCWPEFEEEDFVEALRSYQKRRRSSTT